MVDDLFLTLYITHIIYLCEIGGSNTILDLIIAYVRKCIGELK
jgi:hypothetical protein